MLPRTAAWRFAASPRLSLRGADELGVYDASIRVAQDKRLAPLPTLR